MAIGEPFELVDRHEASLVPPGDAVYDLAAALPLFNQRVSSAEALESGELIVRFENGVVIRVPVNQQYENWEIVSPAGEPWLGLPVAASRTCLLVSRDPIERVPRVESDIGCPGGRLGVGAVVAHDQSPECGPAPCGGRPQPNGREAPQSSGSRRPDRGRLA